MKTYGIELYEQPSGPIWNADKEMWENYYVRLPMIEGKKLLLIPKWLVVQKPIISAKDYYNNEVLEYLQSENLNSNSSLVEVLKSGKRRVTKKKLKEQPEYKLTKEFLYEITNRNPRLLKRFRERKNKEIDISKIKDEEIDDLEKEVAKELKEQLTHIQAGMEGEKEFQNFCIGAMEFIFYPNCINPESEEEIHDGRKRIDITYMNSSNNGFFYNMRTSPNILANKIIIECKNYCHDIKNPELDQIAGRFSPTFGKFGILLARKFENRNQFINRCRDTYKDQRGLVIPLVDEDTIELLNLIEKGERSKIEKYMYRKYEEIIN